MRLDDAVAVVADNWWQAKKAVDALAITWDDGGHGQVSSASIRTFCAAGWRPTTPASGARTAMSRPALAKAVKRIEAEYDVPFLAMPPWSRRTARLTSPPTRSRSGRRRRTARPRSRPPPHAAGVPPHNVIVHKTMLGGGFGRRGLMQDFVSLAVLIAKQVGQPVKVLWSREEDMRHDFYRPVAMAQDDGRTRRGRHAGRLACSADRQLDHGQ